MREPLAHVPEQLAGTRSLPAGEPVPARVGGPRGRFGGRVAGFGVDVQEGAVGQREPVGGVDHFAPPVRPPQVGAPARDQFAPAVQHHRHGQPRRVRRVEQFGANDPTQVHLPEVGDRRFLVAPCCECEQFRLDSLRRGSWTLLVQRGDKLAPLLRAGRVDGVHEHHLPAEPGRDLVLRAGRLGTQFQAGRGCGDRPARRVGCGRQMRPRRRPRPFSERRISRGRDRCGPCARGRSSGTMSRGGRRRARRRVPAARRPRCRGRRRLNLGRELGNPPGPLALGHRSPPARVNSGRDTVPIRPVPSGRSRRRT